VGCTFAPVINHLQQSRKRPVSQATAPTSPKVFEHLYKQGIKQLQKWRKNDRLPTEIEFERQKEECSFNPKFVATKDLSKVFGKALVAS